MWSSQEPKTLSKFLTEHSAGHDQTNIGYWQFLNLANCFEKKCQDDKSIVEKSTTSRRKIEIEPENFDTKHGNSGVPKSRPTWFLAFPITASHIHARMKNVQETLIGFDKHSTNNLNGTMDTTLGSKYLPAVIPVSKAHITLFLFNTNETDAKNNVKTDGRLQAAKDCINNAIEAYCSRSTERSRNPILPTSIDISIKGISHFNNEVIYAKANMLGQNFKEFWLILSNRLLQNRFISAEDASISLFTPHVTLMKLSQQRTHYKKRHMNKYSREKLPRKFPRNCIQGLENYEFGEQIVDQLHLYSLCKKAEDAEEPAYYCEKIYFISDH